MKSENRHALKEWAVVCEALAEGRQTVLMRKGGIIEKGGDGQFEVEHREFFLYPTYVHQKTESLQDEWKDRIPAAPESTHEVTLSLYAVVTNVERITDLERALSFRDRHILNDEAIQMRFHYRDNPILHAVEIDVHRLPTPHRIPATPEYDGCVSWVDLGFALSTT